MVSDKRGTNPVAMTIIKREKEREKERDRERKRERQIGIFFLNNKNYIVVPLTKEGGLTIPSKCGNVSFFRNVFYSIKDRNYHFRYI